MRINNLFFLLIILLLIFINSCGKNKEKATNGNLEKLVYDFSCTEATDCTDESANSKVFKVRIYNATCFESAVGTHKPIVYGSGKEVTCNSEPKCTLLTSGSMSYAAESSYADGITEKEVSGTDEYAVYTFIDTNGNGSMEATGEVEPYACTNHLLPTSGGSTITISI